MTELKSCPFCGGEAIFGKSEATMRVRVVCVSCLASSDWVRGASRAAELWNRRAVDADALLALADELDKSAEINVYPRERGGGVSMMGDELAELERWTASRISEACGEEASDGD